MIRCMKLIGAALCLALLGEPVLAQAADPRAPEPAAPNPNAILAELSNVAKITEAAKTCNWTDPINVLASESILAIRAADLKAMVIPEVRGQVDAALEQAKASVAGMACKQPDGTDLPQQHQAKMFVMDQYWRMIAHVDVLGSLRWGEVFRYTPEERAALDKEIAHIKEFKGYGYYEAANPLETLAEKTQTLACRERPSNGKPCRPVPAELENNAATVKIMIETTEAFGKAVAAEKIKEQQDFLAAVGDITQFSAFKDEACKADMLVVKTGEARVKSKETEDTLGKMTHQVMFVEKFRLGKPQPIGWVLLFRSMMYAGDNAPYVVIAEDGGEWDEESARMGAGEVKNLYDEQKARIASLPPGERQKASEAAQDAISKTYFDNFVSMGLMQSIKTGGGNLKLVQCAAD
ncbi:hypothetical protein HY29_06445 [Hyphomonas beringensis]|uniref:Imelysin-like domain-containing protein n=2 Tax=Hyphomonas beringensis TaxID=1280946 RepID=A0A062U4A3_9PROT|nr:hypothetical protein HY29_06445 [Hyphomonas beringensis]